MSKGFGIFKKFVHDMMDRDSASTVGSVGTGSESEFFDTSTSPRRGFNKHRPQGSISKDPFVVDTASNWHFRRCPPLLPTFSLLHSEVRAKMSIQGVNRIFPKSKNIGDEFREREDDENEEDSFLEESVNEFRERPPPLASFDEIISQDPNLQSIQGIQKYNLMSLGILQRRNNRSQDQEYHHNLNENEHITIQDIQQYRESNRINQYHHTQDHHDAKSKEEGDEEKEMERRGHFTFESDHHQQRRRPSSLPPPYPPPRPLPLRHHKSNSDSALYIQNPEDTFSFNFKPSCPSPSYPPPAPFFEEESSYSNHHQNQNEQISQNTTPFQSQPSSSNSSHPSYSMPTNTNQNKKKRISKMPPLPPPPPPR